MFTYTNMLGNTIVGVSLARALAFATIAYDIHTFMPIIRNANGIKVLYGIAANGRAYALDNNAKNNASSLDSYFARQAM